MKRYSMQEARANLADLVARAAYGKERIMIGRHQRNMAVLVPVEDADLLERLEDEIDRREADRALKKKDRAIDWAEAKKSLDQAKKRRAKK
jgi:prevent-host-death family protein